MFDSGSIILLTDTIFARKVGCVIYESRLQDCVVIGANAYMTVGLSKFKITLDGSLVYFVGVWVGNQVEQKAILSMDDMFQAGSRLKLADGTLCLAEKVRIGLVRLKPCADHKYCRNLYMLIVKNNFRNIVHIEHIDFFS